MLVAEALQRPRDRLVDDLHGAAADQLLELHQRQVRLDTGGVAVHHEADGAGRREHARPVRFGTRSVSPSARHSFHGSGRGVDRAVHAAEGRDLAVGVGVLAHDPLVGRGVARVTVVGPDDGGQLRGAAVGGAGHQRRDRGGDGPAALGVVGMAGRHQQRAEVGVTDAELPVGPGGRRPIFSVGKSAKQMEMSIAVMISSTICRNRSTSKALSSRQELQQVKRREVAGGIVQVQVFRARVGRGDSAGFRAGMPVIDRVVVLNARVGAFPGGLRPSCGTGPWRRRSRSSSPVRRAAQVELAARLDGLHELVGDPHRVVGVLVLDAGDVLAAEVHVEPGVAQDADLVLFARLGLDELLDVGVVDVEDDHLGGPPGGAAGLDRARGGVSAAHEGHRAATQCRPTTAVPCWTGSGKGSRPRRSRP